jgi:adenylate cyclase
MSFLNSLSKPEKMSLVIGFCDLHGFVRLSNSMDDPELFTFLNAFWQENCPVLEKSGGQILKFIGDAILVVFPAENASNAVLSLLSFKESCELWLENRGKKNRMIIKAHIGEVIAGYMGSDNYKWPDIIGQAVNLCATLNSNGFAMTPELFRKLEPAERQLFKKHTAAVTYIPTTEPHRN